MSNYKEHRINNIIRYCLTHRVIAYTHSQCSVFDQIYSPMYKDSTIYAMSRMYAVVQCR